MTSGRPPNSSSFDALWESIDAEEDDDLPPALSAGPPRRAVPEERDTLQPPVPAGEYVATMMELGELDDPSGGTREAGTRTIPKSPPLARGLGLVMAPEHDIVFDDHEMHGLTDPADIEQRRNAVTAPVRPRVETPSPFAKAGAMLPVPRAPSVPPPDDTDVTEPGGLSFEGLDAPDDSPWGTPPKPVATPVPAVAMPPRAPARMTPPTRPAGLRLGKGPAATPPSARNTPPPAPAAAVPAGVPAGTLNGRRSQPLRVPQMLESEPPPSSVVDRLREMQSLFEANNYSSALVMAESVLTGEPSNDTARRCAESCREKLAQKYLGRLGGRANIPRVIMPPEEMRWLSLDHRAGFLLSSIDGGMSIDEVLDVCSMPELDALRIMFELKEQGVIEIAEPPRRGRR